MYKVNKFLIIFLFVFNYSFNSVKNLINNIFKINYLTRSNYYKYYSNNNINVINKISENFNNDSDEEDQIKEIKIKYIKNVIKDRSFNNSYYLIFYGNYKKPISEDCFFKILNDKKFRNLYLYNLSNKFKIYDEANRFRFLIDFNLYLDEFDNK